MNIFDNDTLDKLIDLELTRAKNDRAGRRWFLLWLATLPTTAIVTGIIGWTYSSFSESIDFKENIVKARSQFRTELKNFWINQSKIGNILNSMVWIHTWSGSGSGFFIWRNIILTAGHVIWNKVDSNNHLNYSNPKKPNKIYDTNGIEYKATKVYGSPKNDLWLIKVSESWKWFLNPFHWAKTSKNQISLWFWWSWSNTSQWYEVEWFWNTNFDKEREGEYKNYSHWDIGFITNDVISWDSWWPILDQDWNVKWLIIHKYILDHTISEKNIGFKSYVKYWWMEPLKDIQDFLNTL